MKSVTRVSVATAMIAVAVVFGWKMQSEIPTGSDHKIVEDFVRARDNAFRTQDATAYRALFASDFQTKGNLMVFEEYSPAIVESLIKNVPFTMIDVTSTVQVTRVREHGVATKQISFLSRSSYRGGESVSADGFTVTFVQRDGKWQVSLMEPYQDPRHFFYGWF